MELEGIMLSKISQSEKDFISYDLSYDLFIRFHSYVEFKKNREHSEREGKIKQDEIREGDKS